MIDLEKQLIEYKKEIETEKEEVIDIFYYGKIRAKDEQLHALYLVIKQIEEQEPTKEVYLDKDSIATVNEKEELLLIDNTKIELESIVGQIRDVLPVSMKRLQELKQNKEKTKKESEIGKKDEFIKEEVEQGQQSTKKAQIKAKDTQIDLGKKITETQDFFDLVPESKEKGMKEVYIRRKNMTEFEFYGIDEEGNELLFESLKPKEGTNPKENINEINQDGSQVKKGQASTMLEVDSGENKQNGQNGFMVSLDEVGIVQVQYYQKAKAVDETQKDAARMSSIPVNLKNTNQKQTQLEVREYAEKGRNPDIQDNIKLQNEILEKDSSTTLSNIDDNPYNDEIESMPNHIEKLMQDAMNECKISRKGLEEAMKSVQREGDTIQQRIQKAVDLIYEQTRGEIN